MRRLALPLAALLLGLAGRAPAAGAAPGVLTIINDVQDPATLDPHKQFSAKNHTICQQIFDGLVRFDPQGRIEPALAESWQRIDPLRMRFSLRKNVRFHDGEAFDAESVRYSILRYLDPKTHFPAAGFLSAIAEVVVLDAHTVEIVTRFPDGLLLHRLAGFVLIVPPRYLREAGDEKFAREPIGTGAFRFKSWSPGDRIELAANESYWLSGYPKAGGLIFRFVSRKNQIRELLENRADIVMDIPGTQTLQVQKSKNARVIKGKTFYTALPIFRFTRGPLADRRVRRALNHATDVGNLIRYDLMGNGVPLTSLSMPGEEGHDPELASYAYDPKKAAALLAEAGYPRGFKLKATVKESAERTAKILAAQWKRIGVKLSYNLMTDAEMHERFRDPQYDLGIGDTQNPMCHSYFISAIMFYSKSPFSLGRDPELDSQLEAMASTIDDAKRAELTKSLNRYIQSEALSVFTYQKIQTYGILPGVSFDHYVSGMPYFFAATTTR